MDFIATIHQEIVEFQEEVRKRFVWNLYLITACVVFCLGIYNYIENIPFYIFYLCVVPLDIICMILLKKLKDKHYKWIANLQFFIVSILLIWSVFSEKKLFHFQEALWMMILVLSAFFVLGKKWGGFYLILNSIVYAFYFNSGFVSYIDFHLALQPKMQLIWTIEITLALAVIGYVMIQFKKINQYAVDRTYKTLAKIKKEKRITENHNLEKTNLLLEVHHRVKDNLKVIVQLLKIQAKDVSSEEAKDGFQIAINRINAMALIHQQTYQKEDVVDTDIKSYISTLITGLIKTVSLDKEIDLTIDIQLKELNADRLVPMGLIINELTSNSLKHAFHSIERKPKINLAIQRLEGNEISVQYSDNGKWKETRKGAFGMQLIDAFTEQLDGEYNLEITTEGTFYSFTLYDKTPNQTP